MSKNQGPSRNAAEWFKLITEARQSGLSDTVWCLQNDVPRSTFSQAVSRLKKMNYAIPKTHTPPSPLDFTSGQDVVEISISQDTVPVKYTETVQEKSILPVSKSYLDNSHTIEIQLGAAVIKLTNEADPNLVKIIAHSLMGGNYAG